MECQHRDYTLQPVDHTVCPDAGPLMTFAVQEPHSWKHPEARLSLVRSADLLDKRRRTSTRDLSCLGNELLQSSGIHRNNVLVRRRRSASSICSLSGRLPTRSVHSRRPVDSSNSASRIFGSRPQFRNANPWTSTPESQVYGDACQKHDAVVRAIYDTAAPSSPR